MGLDTAQDHNIPSLSSSKPHGLFAFVPNISGHSMIPRFSPQNLRINPLILLLKTKSIRYRRVAEGDLSLREILIRALWCVLTETVDVHTADQIFRVGVHGGARVRADVRFSETGDDQAQVVARRKRGGHVHSSGPAKNIMPVNLIRCIINQYRTLVKPWAAGLMTF